jgi:hypothetical protein
MMIRWLSLMAIGLCGVPAWGAEPVAPAPTPTSAVTKDGAEIDPNGRASNDLTQKAPRYYVWYDSTGWHLRTTSEKGTFGRFDGTIKVTGGTIGKMRPIGLETKGTYKDTWKLSEDRTGIEFQLVSSSTFDGFDFSVTGADAQVEFNLNISNKGYPNRIFVGKDGAHPKEVKFPFPGTP